MQPRGDITRYLGEYYGTEAKCFPAEDIVKFTDVIICFPANGYASIFSVG